MPDQRQVPTRPGWWWRSQENTPRLAAVEVYWPRLRMTEMWARYSTDEDGAPLRIWEPERWLCEIPSPAELAALRLCAEALIGGIGAPDRKAALAALREARGE